MIVRIELSMMSGCIVCLCSVLCGLSVVGL